MASSQVEFASSTSPFGCINSRNHHHGATQGKHLYNHFVRDHLKTNNHNNKDNSHSRVVTNNTAKNNLKTLRFTSSEREHDELSTLVSPHHDEPSPSSSSSSSSSSSPLRKQKPSPISVIPSDVSNLGASCLVQMWEKRLTQSNKAKSSSTPKSSPNAASSPNGSSSEELADSPQEQISNEAEQNERSLRVADIIKRLTAMPEEMVVNQVQEQSCLGSPEHSLENKSFVIKSPRIRGRQAFNDLLMQMEKDRHAELNNVAERAAVSKFSCKGRIQALLRLRLMQRGIVAKDNYRLPSTQVIKQSQGSVIMRLRERFSTGITENGSTAVEAEVIEPRTSCNEKENKVKRLDSPPNSTQNPVSPTDHIKEKAPPSSDVTEPISETQNVETSSSMVDLNAEEASDKVEAASDQEKHDHVADQTTYDEIEEEEEEEEEEEGSEEDYGERIYDEIEDVETSEHIYREANFDWIRQISKPKSYWEDRRQAWYKEILDNVSEDDDLCLLLRRRTVSNFLSSQFRERMDRLMESHKGTRMDLFASQDDDDHHGKIQQLVALLQQRLCSAKRDHDQQEEEEGDEEEEEKQGDQEEEDEEEEEEEEDEEEEDILISDSYNGESDSINQSSPSLWRYGDNEGGDESEDRSASASIRQPSQSPSFYYGSHQNSSSTNPPSIEMELIYDLRGHMKQLYQEMSELRKSIKSCMDMQIILQKSLNRETPSAKGGRKPRDRVLKKGNCCICSEKKADSLFYRCGHMCMCLKCASELQWKNGICPICEAPIVDVVRVYVDA